jgi:hypothetical protein
VDRNKAKGHIFRHLVEPHVSTATPVGSKFQKLHSKCCRRTSIQRNLEGSDTHFARPQNRRLLFSQNVQVKRSTPILRRVVKDAPNVLWFEQYLSPLADSPHFGAGDGHVFFFFFFVAR